MRSAGKVTSVPAEAVARAIAKDISRSGQLSAGTLKKLEDAGYSFGNDVRQDLANITSFKKDINASRFAESAQFNPNIKGESARVLAMVKILERSSPEVAGHLLAFVINNTE